MRELFEKYYTVRLFFQDDPHFRPDIEDLPGEFDTAEEAYAVGEKALHKYDFVSPHTGEVCNVWEVQVHSHYAPVNSNYTPKHAKGE